MYRDLSTKITHEAIKTHFDLVKEECGVLDYKEVEVEIRTLIDPFFFLNNQIAKC